MEETIDEFYTNCVQPFDIVDLGLPTLSDDNITLPLPSPSGRSSEETTSTISPPQQNNQTNRCMHCLLRLQDMSSSPLIECQVGSKLWNRNWTSSECFGACTRSDFCVNHGFPVGLCSNSQHQQEALPQEDTSHVIVHYSGIWNRISSTSMPRIQQQQNEQEHEENLRYKRQRTATNSPLVSEGQCTECQKRIRKLSGLCWLRKRPELISKASLLLQSSETSCQGFCQASFCCKLHIVPSINQKCSFPHGTTERGNDFAYYCANDSCCDGKWFSREETHNRAVRAKGSPIVTESPQENDILRSVSQEKSAKQQSNDDKLQQQQQQNQKSNESSTKNAENKIQTGDSETQTYFKWSKFTAMSNNSKFTRILLGISLGISFILLAFLISVWVLSTPRLHKGIMCWIITNGSTFNDGCSSCSLSRDSGMIFCNAPNFGIDFQGSLDSRTFSELQSWNLNSSGLITNGLQTSFPLIVTEINSANGLLYHISLTLNHTSIFTRWMGTWDFISF